MKQDSLFCFSLKLRDLPNHQGASFRTLDIFGKLWMSRGALTWFGLRLFGAMVWRVVGIDIENL
jgi:hypothetical protein